MPQTHRLFISTAFEKNKRIALDPQAHQIVSQVLRQKQGAPLELLNGLGQVAKTTLIEIKKKSSAVVVDQIKNAAPLVPKIRLVAGLLKGEKMTWLVQKATELGVSAIDVVETQACVAKYKPAHIDKYQKTAIEAMRQSGNPFLPTIRGFASLVQWQEQTDLSAHRAFFHEKEDAQWIHTWPDATLIQDIDVLVGPEGGLLPEETQWLTDQGFCSLRIHPYVLRAETAALMGLSFFRAMLGQK